MKDTSLPIRVKLVVGGYLKYTAAMARLLLYNNVMDKKINYSEITKNIFIVILFFLLLTTLRVDWMNYHAIPEIETAKKGVIDLNDIDTNANFRMKLNGEWTFYPNAYIFPDDLGDSLDNGGTHSNVPETWEQYFEEEGDSQYGSYRLRILKEHENPQLYGIMIPESLSPYEVYVDGQRIGGLGDLVENQRGSSPTPRPARYFFTLDSDESEIVIQGFHSNILKTGGLSKAVIFGDFHSIEQAKIFSIVTQTAVFIVLSLYFFYTILLYSIGFRDKSLIYFSLLAFTTAITVIISHDKFLLLFIPENWVWGNKIFLSMYVLAILFFTAYIRTLVEGYLKIKVLRVLNVLYLMYFVFLLVAPIEIISRTLIMFTVLYLIFPIIVVALILVIVMKGRNGITFLLLTTTAVASNSITVTINQRSDFPIYYPFDLLIAITAISAYWFFRHFQTTQQTKKLSSKLQQEMDRKDDFLANTSHELRNPLHGMINIAQIVLRTSKVDLPKDQQKNLHLLVSIGDYMTFMLNDLLDLTRLKENRLKLHMQEISVSAALIGVTDMLRYMLHGKPVQLILEIEEDLPPIWADENRLIQALFNMLHNAIKFTVEGTITVRAIKGSDEIIIEIEDTGIGIDETFKEKIFERYQQKDATMTGPGGGLGIGLAISKELTELQGGCLSVDSVVGEGSIFRLTLPYSTTFSAVELESTHTTTVFEEKSKHFIEPLQLSRYVDDRVRETLVEPTKPRILLVDDDPVNLQILSETLIADDYFVETVASGREALASIENETWDLLISDIMMPQMSGYELASIVRKQYGMSELPILFLTARSRREDLLTAFHVGANDYITKPVDPLELKSRVQAQLLVRQSTEERLRLEAAWLQAQINPHFFFNVLNSIYILSEIDQEKMQLLIEAFSDYLQTGFDFSNTNTTVPLEYELDIVRSYITIEKIRFDERIQVVWDLDDGLVFSLPPLSIQTIVENAINHGVLPNPDGGIITIQIAEEAHHYLIRIEDNGVGYNQQALHNEDGRGGVGIPNTNLRLKQLYREGLTITSTLGQGTVVTFRIPKE